jgi:hypothetical protein
LTGLSNGQHNVTVYATDEYGYTGVSDTLFFNVEAPIASAPEYPVVPLIAASAIAVASAAAGLLKIYFKRRKR